MNIVSWLNLGLILTKSLLRLLLLISPLIIGSNLTKNYQELCSILIKRL